MKFSYPVKQNEYWSLVQRLSSKFGVPRASEVMVLYVKNPDDIRVTISRDKMEISWEIAEGDEFQRRRKTVSLSSESLKDKIEFSLGDPQRECHIGSTPILTFDQKNPDFEITLREATFIGPIFSISFDPEFVTEELAQSEIAEYRDVLLNDLVERVNSINRPFERCFKKVGRGLQLNEKIFDFCKRNGINNPVGRTYSYEQVQSSRSNDYSSQQNIFEAILESNLLEIEPTPFMSDNRDLGVSIIIPYFNYPDTLDAVLAGISGQIVPKELWEKVEVVIVDDGSALPVKFKENWANFPFKIKIVSLHTNSGVSHARHIGLTHASEEIVIFMDSDIVISKNYLYDHYIRNAILDDCIFVSFKENIEREAVIESGDETLVWSTPNYENDLRISKKIDSSSVGVYETTTDQTVSILEDTNYFKDFHGSRTFGIFDLSSMVTGHNFSSRKSTFERIKPFTKNIRGWGMEDVYLGSGPIKRLDAESFL